MQNQPEAQLKKTQRTVLKMKNTLNFVITKPAQGARTDLNELKDAIVSGKKSTIDIRVESPDTWHLYGRTLSKIEDICMGKKWRNKPKANIISEKQAVNLED